MKKITMAVFTIPLLALAVALVIKTYSARTTDDARADGLELLQSGDYASALAHLAIHGDERDISSVIPLLENEDRSVRFHAARTLSQLSGHEIPVPASITNRADFSGPARIHYFNLSDTNTVDEYVSRWREWTRTRDRP